MTFEDLVEKALEALYAAAGDEPVDSHDIDNVAYKVIPEEPADLISVLTSYPEMLSYRTRNMSSGDTLYLALYETIAEALIDRLEDYLVL